MLHKAKVVKPLIELFDRFSQRIAGIACGHGNRLLLLTGIGQLHVVKGGSSLVVWFLN